MYKMIILLYKVNRYERHGACRSFFIKESILSRFLIDYYNNLHQKGLEKINSGDITPFIVHKKMKEDLIVADMIDVDDQRWNQILNQLIQMESPGFSFFLVNRDFPAHVTIQVSEGGMRAQSSLKQNAERMYFISFNRMILDPAGNILLVSESIPQLISKWRELASLIMKSYGGEPVPIQILHSTFARFTQAQSLTDDERKYLVKFVDDWNSSFQRSPIGIHTKSVFVGTVYDLLKSK